MTFCCEPRPKFSPGARSSGACSRAKKARPSRKASARRPEPDRSSTSSLAKCCGFRERNSPACGRTSTSRSRASRSASSALSRLGTFRSRSPPGRSRRRSPMATRWSSSLPILFPAAPTRSLKSSCAPVFPRACSISSSGGVPWSARRSSTTRKSTRSPSQARSPPAPKSRPPAPRPCVASNSKWAARIRSSCLPTPISRMRSNARSTAPISRPASAAPRRRASLSRSRFTGALRMRSRSGCADSSSTTR